MNPMMKVLFVCTANKMRSRTAEEIYRDDRRFSVRSAGTGMFATKVIDEEILSWADYIVVMEKEHRDQIRDRFSAIYSEKKILCLNIPDIYYFMDPTLMREVKERFEKLYSEALKE